MAPPSASHTRVVIDDIFANPPDGPDALARMLADVAPATAREHIVARLREPALGRVQATIAGHALATLGLGDARDEIVAVLEDATLSEHARNAVIQSLASLPPDELLLLMPSLSDEAIDAIMRLPLREMVADVQADPASAQLVTDALREVSVEQRPTLLDDIAAARRELGVRAADLYGHALGDAEIAGDERLREPMLLALIEDADDAGVVLLRALRAKAPKKLRAPFQAALARIEDALAGGERAKPAAAGVEAWASHPDGQGALVVFVSFRNPDGTLLLVNLCLRLTEDLRSGFVEPRSSKSERDGILREFTAESGIEFVRVPVGEAVALVDEAVARGVAMGSKPDADMRRGVEILARVARAEAPPPMPGRAIDYGEVQRLLGLRRHDAWYFDFADLAKYGVPSPGNANGDPRAWSEDALRTLATSPMRERVIAMTRYMSRWAQWKGDADEAALWTTLADGVARDFATSPIATLMLARLVDPSLGAPTDAAPVGLASFILRFPEVAATETRTIFLEGQAPIPDDAYELHEFYCDDPACECDRVQLHVFAREADAYVAVIGHAFTAEAAREDGLAQTFVDPLHPSAPYADALCAVIAQVLRDDTAYHRRLQAHYAMMKPAAQRAAPAPRAVKVGPNEPCPCGSGKKYKKCCRP